MVSRLLLALAAVVSANPAWIDIILESLGFTRDYTYYKSNSSLSTHLDDCHLTFDHLVTEFVPPYTIGYRFYAMGFKCAGEFLVSTEEANFTGRARIAISGIDPFMLNMTIIPSQTEPVLPHNLTLSLCSIPRPQLATPLFYGVGKEIAESYLQEMTDHIEEEAPLHACRNLTEAIEKVSLILGDVMTAVEEYLVPPVPAPPPKVDTSMPLVNWHDVKPALKIMQHILNGAENVTNALMHSIGLGDFSYDNHEYTPLFKPSPKLAFGVRWANISGLDTFGNISLLQPVQDDNYTLASRVLLHSLNISLQFFVEVGAELVVPEVWQRRGQTGENGFKLLKSGKWMATESITIRLRDVDLQGSAVIALRKGHFRGTGVRVQQFLEPKCLLNMLSTMNITYLDLNIQFDQLSLHNPNAEEEPVNELINNIIAMMQQSFAPGLNAAVRGILGAPIRELINMGLGKAISNSSITEHCPAAPALPPRFIHWNENKILKVIRFLLDGPDVEGHIPLNEIIAALTQSAVGGITLPLPNLTLNFTNLPFPKQKDLVVFLVEPKLAIEGLASFVDNDAFKPVPGAPYNLSNQFGMGFLNVTLSTSLVVNKNGTDIIDVSYIGVRLSMSELRVLVDGLLQVDNTTVKNLLVEEALNGSCLASSLSGSVIHKLHVALRNVTVSVVQEYSEDVQMSKKDFAPPALDYVLKAVINAQLDRLVYQSPFVCKNVVPPSRDPKPSFLDSDFAHYFGGVAVVLAISSSVVAMVWFVWGREKKVIEDPSEPEVKNTSLLLANPTGMAFDKRVAVGGTGGGWRGALWQSPRIPAVLRYGVILVLLGDIALFLAANIASGAIVNLYITYLGPDGVSHQQKLGHLFDFNLGNSIRHMWEADVFALAILIAAFSGAWAYSKLLLMLACWVAPPTSFLTPQRRERLLILLDSLGKWSMIDAYVLVMMMVAFRFRFGAGTTWIDVIVEAHFGFYAFTAAAIVSLMMSHLILFFHRFAEGHDPTSVAPGHRREALRVHSYWVVDPNNRPSRKGSRLERLNTCSQWGVVVLLIVTGILIAIGADIDSFKFHFQGAAGFALGDKPDRTYSLISLGQQLPQAALDPDSMGTSFIQTTYFMFALVLPLVHLASMVFLWVTPLTLKTQYWVFVICEVLNAWASLEVFISSVLASVLEIETFAVFLVGDKCDALTPLLDRLLGVKQCFTVGAFLQSGSGALFVASVITLVSGQVVMRNCHKALTDRMAKDGYANLAHSMGKKKSVTHGSKSDHGPANQNNSDNDN